MMQSGKAFVRSLWWKQNHPITMEARMHPDLAMDVIEEEDFEGGINSEDEAGDVQPPFCACVGAF
jgi:hypothetical protein